MDLSGLDTSPQSPPSFPEFPTPTDSLNATSQEMGLSLLDDELMSLGDHDQPTHDQEVSSRGSGLPLVATVHIAGANERV